MPTRITMYLAEPRREGSRPPGRVNTTAGVSSRPGFPAAPGVSRITVSAFAC
jgi:hypothetical protein